jgi:hypothetical protein
LYDTSTYGSNTISIGTSDNGLMLPLVGFTCKELAYSPSPLMDSLSKLKDIGTSSRFLSLTSSLFLPLINSGPKSTFPTSKKTFGSMTYPTIMNYKLIFFSGI